MINKELKLLTCNPNAHIHHACLQDNPIGAINDYCLTSMIDNVDDIVEIALYYSRTICLDTGKIFVERNDYSYSFGTCGKTVRDNHSMRAIRLQSKYRDILGGLEDKDLLQVCKDANLADVSWPVNWDDNSKHKIADLIYKANITIEKVTGIKGALGLGGRVRLSFRITDNDLTGGFMHRQNTWQNTLNAKLELEKKYLIVICCDNDNVENILKTIYHEWFHAFDAFIADKYYKGNHIRFFSCYFDDVAEEKLERPLALLKMLSSKLHCKGRVFPSDAVEVWKKSKIENNKKPHDHESVNLIHKMIDQGYDLREIYTLFSTLKDNSDTMICNYFYIKLVWIVDKIIKTKITKRHPFDIAYRIIRDDNKMSRVSGFYNLYSDLEYLARWFEYKCFIDYDQKLGKENVIYPIFCPIFPDKR